jgi:hypothetical protein
MKRLLRVLIVLLVLIAALVVTAHFYLEVIVIKAVETAGPRMLGVPVTLEQASIRLLDGHVTLRGLALGNPKGFKTDEAISVDKVTIDLDPRTLLNDVIVIKRIRVDAPDITYELGLGKSNIGRILEGSAATEKEEEPSGKKVVIDDVLIENGRIRISATMAMGIAAPIPLPSIHLTDIGKEKRGASPLEVTKQILVAIVGTVTKVVTGTVGLVGDGAKAVGGVAVGAVEGTAEVAGQGVHALGTGAKAVGGAVAGAGGAVGKGASRLVGGVTGIFKSDAPTNEPPAEIPAE